VAGVSVKILNTVVYCVGFDVPTAVVVKSSAFWIITPGIPVKELTG
jgi:hypothetical protein